MEPISRSPDAPSLPGSGSQPDSVRAEVMRQAAQIAGEPPRPVPRAVLCPFCGSVTAGTDRCSNCSARFDPLSRQATQNHMGPWSVRDDANPYRPGCTYETLARLIKAGTVGLDTVIRGPTTRQFWTLARHTPGVAHLLGVCHNCRAETTPDAFQCPSCHASFTADRDRQHLGIGAARPLPGQANPELIAMQAGPSHAAPATGASDVTRIDTGSGGSGRGYVSEQDALAAARSRAAQWKSTSEQDRKRGVFALILASLVIMASLFYAGLVSERTPAPAVSDQNQPETDPQP